MKEKVLLFALTLFIVFLSISSKAQLKPQRTIGKYYIEIPLKGKVTIPFVAQLGLIIDHPTTNEIIYAYATLEDLKLLEKHNIYYEKRKEFDQVGIEVYGYLTYQDLSKKLEELEKNNPSILKLFSVGKSVQGREMWIMKISDNVLLDEPEAEVRLISTMHGNEIVGQELLVRLIEFLSTEYNHEKRISNLINNSEIWIMPNMNPDGTALKRRGNVNWVDLNRDFPDPRIPEENNLSGRALETQNVMRFVGERNFVLAANFHTGALVVNYPWDHKARLLPEDSLAIFLSKDYAYYNIPMKNSTRFRDGITNGYAWYPIYGGMQDWSYHYYNTLEVTVELYSRKWPSYGVIDTLWNENRDSLLHFIEKAQLGLHGFVTDNNGNPLKAEMAIEGIEKTSTSFLPYGDFYRLLAPGNYLVTFRASGYTTKQYSITISEQLIPLNLNVILSKKKGDVFKLYVPSMSSTVGPGPIIPFSYWNQ